jgi:hypothetical protein
MTAELLLEASKDVAVAGYVQMTDVEQECDGLLSYDRTPKFSAVDTAAIRNANILLVGSPQRGVVPADENKSKQPQPRWLTEAESPR